MNSIKVFFQVRHQKIALASKDKSILKPEEGKIYIKVPYFQKDAVKNLGVHYNC